RAIGLQGVRRAIQDNGPGLRIVLGHIDTREEPDSVAHGNALIVFGIMLGEPGGIRVTVRRLGADGQEQQNSDELAKGATAGFHGRALSAKNLGRQERRWAPPRLTLDASPRPATSSAR